MIKVSVKNSTGSATQMAEMNDFGVIFFESGEISSITAEKSKGHTVSKFIEVVAPIISTVERSEPAKKVKKKG